MATKQRHGLHEDTIENILDKLSAMREELLVMERSLERIAAKPAQGEMVLARSPALPPRPSRFVTPRGARREDAGFARYVRQRTAFRVLRRSIDSLGWD